MEGEIVHGDIADFNAVHNAIEGMDAVIHTAVYYSGDIEIKTPSHQPQRPVERPGIRPPARPQPAVHIGSCQTVHPKGIFFTADVRRPDGGLYAVCKRLQEEMCRQFYDAFDMRIVVLRPQYIVDSRLGIDKYRKKMGSEEMPLREGWVCRHDLAEACRLAVESETVDFDIFHIVGTPESTEPATPPTRGRRWADIQRQPGTVSIAMMGRFQA